MSTTLTTPEVEIPKGDPNNILPGKLFRRTPEFDETSGVTFRHRFLHHDANLLFLNCGEYAIAPGAETILSSLPDRESILWMWKGTLTAEVNGKAYPLANYDTIYVPKGAPFRLRNTSGEPAVVIQTSAPAKNVHPVFHSKFAEFKQREDRIRRLHQKIVYLMFDVTEGADKLVAGYTIYEPYTRAWPPHNHTDQEETYIFINGHGSMEVYETPEKMTFVHNVNEGDLVTIPFLNYHPVFSQEDPLTFIWCIAGERYWVGDKNKSFMQGTGEAITT
jgi:mannose-6-phosphate isomerase-like protein (cupin superfamily)